MRTEDIAKFQGKTLLYILQAYFERDAAMGKLKAIFKPGTDLSWIMDDLVREVFHQFTVVVWQKDGDQEVPQGVGGIKVIFNRVVNGRCGYRLAFRFANDCRSGFGLLTGLSMVVVRGWVACSPPTFASPTG